MARKAGSKNISRKTDTTITLRALIGRSEGKTIDMIVTDIEKELANSLIRSIPDKETIRRKVSEIFRRDEPLDCPWSSVSLADYPISPELLPTVITVWAKAIEEGRILTIRQALWVARLCYVFKNKSTDILWEAACTASFREKSINLGKYGYPTKREHILDFWQEDAYLYNQIADAAHLIIKLNDEYGRQFQNEGIKE